MDYNVTVETNGDINISIGGIGAYGGSPITFASITSKPTTLVGYGITDAAAATHTHTFVGITSKPTTLLGYGITDAAPSSHVGATGVAHGNSTTSVAGFMSAADKTKLDGLAITAGTTAPNNADGQPNGAIYVKY